jgi:hypothetical protein
VPEAFACLFVFAVCVAAYIGATLNARDPARHNASEDLATLRRHHAWLEQRLAVAVRENWGDDMVAQIAAERAQAAARIWAREAR